MPRRFFSHGGPLRWAGLGLTAFMTMSTGASAQSAQEESGPRESAPIYGYFAPLGLTVPFAHHNFDFTTPAGRKYNFLSSGAVHTGITAFGLALGAWVGKGFAIAAHGEGVTHMPVASLYGKDSAALAPGGILGLDLRALVAWHPGGNWNAEVSAGYASYAYGVYVGQDEVERFVDGYSVDNTYPENPLRGPLGSVGVGYTWLVEGGGGVGLLLRLQGGHFTRDSWSVTSIGPSLAFRIMMSSRK